jgi:hypothetical protein
MIRIAGTILTSVAMAWISKYPTSVLPTVVQMRRVRPLVCRTPSANKSVTEKEQIPVNANLDFLGVDGLPLVGLEGN